MIACWTSVTCLLLAGCGGRKEIPVGTVSGTVTLNGAPVKTGTVVFLDPKTGVGASAPLDGQGRFSIDVPVRTGRYSVALQAPSMPAPHEMLPPGHEMKPDQSTYQTFDVPNRLQSIETSGVSVEVKEGKNALPIEFASK